MKPIYEGNKKPFSGTAADKSKWTITVDVVVQDMLDNETADDPWPRPITREMAADWLADNADTIDGWELEKVEKPKPVGMTLDEEDVATGETADAQPFAEGEAVTLVEHRDMRGVVVGPGDFPPGIVVRWEGWPAPYAVHPDNLVKLPVTQEEKPT